MSWRDAGMWDGHDVDDLVMNLLAGFTRSVQFRVFWSRADAIGQLAQEHSRLRLPIPPFDSMDQAGQ